MLILSLGPTIFGPTALGAAILDSVTFGPSVRWAGRLWRLGPPAGFGRRRVRGRYAPVVSETVGLVSRGARRVLRNDLGVPAFRVGPQSRAAAGPWAAASGGALQVEG